VLAQGIVTAGLMARIADLESAAAATSSESEARVATERLTGGADKASPTKGEEGVTVSADELAEAQREALALKQAHDRLQVHKNILHSPGFCFCFFIFIWLLLLLQLTLPPLQLLPFLVLAAVVAAVRGVCPTKHSL
jgi:hypothetical protein